MGSLSTNEVFVEFDDRTLTHLQLVIVQRFRRGEGLMLSWVDSVGIGSGRGAAWLSPFTVVQFRFDGSRLPPIDERWVRLLHEAADSGHGLVVADVDGRLIHAIGDRRPRPS